MWIKTSSVGTSNGYPLYAERGATGNDIWKLEMSGDVAGGHIGKLQITYRDDAGTLDFIKSNGVVNDGQWHHIAITKSGTTVVFYIDGSSSGGGTLSAGNTFTGTVESRIGSDKGDNTALYTGLVDEIRLYNTVLSSGQVSTLSVKGDVQTGLIDRYKLDEGTGTTATDSSGANTGTISGTSWVTGIIPTGTGVRTAASARTTAGARTLAS
jgi:hypothetical protein